MKNGQIFPSKVRHFQYDHRFLFSREMGNIRTCKEIRLLKLWIARIVFVLTFITFLTNEESFAWRFFFPFSAKYFERNFKCFF